MTNLQKKTIAAIKKFIPLMFSGDKAKSIRHIHPRCYVLSRGGEGYIYVACPPQDAEPHMKKLPSRGDGAVTIRAFDESLRAGDWCSVAYVCRAGVQELVAVKAVE